MTRLRKDSGPGPELEENYVWLFCNSLNAIAGVLRHRGDNRLCQVLIEAQRIVTLLMCENKVLKARIVELETSGSKDSQESE